VTRRGTVAFPVDAFSVTGYTLSVTRDGVSDAVVRNDSSSQNAKNAVTEQRST